MSLASVSMSNVSLPKEQKGKFLQNAENSVAAWHTVRTVLLLFLSFIYLVVLRERERENERGKGRIPSRLHNVSAQPDAGLEPMTRKITTQAKKSRVGHLTD